MPSLSRPRSFAPLLFVLLACAVACLAISSQSFWIDEAQTAFKAIPATLHGWWFALYGEHISNVQLPLYMLYIWGWARFFGVSEIALRAANAPWFFLGLFGILHFLRRRPGLRSAVLLLYCLHPFVWCYLDEARPYIMQLSGALLVYGAAFAAFDEPDEPLSACWWWLFAGGLTILCGAGILGVPWGVAITLLLSRQPGFRRSMLRSGRPALLLFVPLLVFLALYFGWTLTEDFSAGYRPMNVASVISVFYDQLGFIGLGPGRSALRPTSVTGTSAVPLATLRPYIAPIALLGLPLGWGFILAARRRFGLSRSRFNSILLLAVSPLCLIFFVGFVRHVRLLGRHLTPLFPFILMAEGWTILLLWRSGRFPGRAAAVLIVIALTLSSVEVRFAFRHSKDDYRSAAAAAVQALAQGESVWWAADPVSADYYHLPTNYNATPGSALSVSGLPARFAAPPDLIFLSKPDIYDPAGNLSQFIAARHYHPVAAYQDFTVWRK
jgi:hypothetical protein